ncbi:hypothetical protein Tco_0756702 [Tanacetum coccineum]
MKKEIDAYETINIELEHSVAKLLKENETLKKHYKDLYDSIKTADLKAQIQEKVFAIAALKNDSRKLKGNSVDTKFAKASVLGKPVLQSLINQSVIRQSNAFKSERPPMSKPQFSSQVDVNNNLSKPVTQHYLPKRRASAFAKPDPMIASSSSKNSSKNMPRFSSNDMVDSTGNLFDSWTGKVDSEPSHGSNVDISKIHKCNKTMDLGAAVATADASDERQQQPDSTSSTSTLATTVTADGNFDFA